MSNLQNSLAALATATSDIASAVEEKGLTYSGIAAVGNQIRSIQLIDTTQFVTKTEAAETYLTKADADSTYVGKSGDATITGNVTISGTLDATTINASSDAELKENIIPYSIPLTLNTVNTYSYNFIGSVEKKVGLLAQELLTVCPEAVSTDANGKYKVDYNAVTAVLLGYIKVLSDRVSILEKQLGTK